MKILSAAQIREADRYTIEHEPISSLDLMERVSQAFVKKFIEIIPEQPLSIAVFSGTGNNGGDGMAIARILIESKRDVRVFILGNPKKGSSDFIHYYERLKKFVKPINLDIGSIPTLSKDEIIIDAIFGSGLSRPVKGLYADVIDWINQSKAPVISVDVASGLYADTCKTDHPIVQPDHTISFQLLKLAFIQPSLFSFVGKWHIVDIKLTDVTQKLEI